jgi:peptidoglycan/xylan/chitin deacetylase (PgdA/CDA1 family)
MVWPRFYHAPAVVQQAFPGLTWRKPENGSRVYLTFDDGPSPEGTPWLLETLAAYQAKATFFCVGANAERYPELVQRITAQGHQLGNHTQHHTAGWRVEPETYLAGVNRAAAVIPTPLFRPPYGQVTPRLAKALRSAGYEVIMWEVLSYDFDQQVNTAQALLKCLKGTRAGTIVVFHDHPKALPQLKAILPCYLQHLHEKGYTFAPL